MTPGATYTDDDIVGQWLAKYESCPNFRYWQAKPGIATSGRDSDGGMSPGQERFHQDPSRFRALVAANQVGKTRAMSAEVWWHMGGDHPYREVKKGPTLGWIIIPILEEWHKVSRKLREIEPEGELHPECSYDPTAGYRYKGKRGIALKNGSLAEPKSGTQDVLALEGDTLDWIAFDEPPKQSHWSGPITRVAVNLGDVWLTFTPFGRPLGWLWAYWEGDPDTGEAGHPEWSIHKLILSPENCPHRTPASIEAQIRGYNSWELAQRVFAEREGVTVGRRLKSFSEACIIDDDELPRDIEHLRLGIDHGEGVGKQIAYLVGVNGNRYTMMRECLPRTVDGAKAGDNPTPRDIARGILWGLDSLGLTVYHLVPNGSGAFGDANSAGLGGGGGKFNGYIERAIADELKLQRCPFSIQTPNKGKGSPAVGEAAINVAMGEGRWLVHRSCGAFIHSARHYVGPQNKDLKDAIDAGRYAVADLLLAPARRDSNGGAVIVTL